MKSQNANTCYLCDEPLDGSDEHIINSCIGGRKKSQFLLCHNCNTRKVKPLDDAIENILKNYFVLLKLKRDRRNNKNLSVPLIDKEGLKFKHYPNEEDYIPTFIWVEDKYVQFDSKSQELINRKLLELEKKTGKKYIRTNMPDTITFYSGDRDLAELEKLKFDNPFFYKAICKIAANYFMSIVKEKQKINYIIDFIKNDALDYKDFVTWFYPTNFTINSLQEGEINHLLYLKCDKEYKVIYMYIELFSTFNFVVLLSTNYEGKDFEKMYCYDLLNRSSISKDIIIKLHRDHFMELRHLWSKGMWRSRQNYFNRLRKLTQKEIDKRNLKK
ncbi:MAG: HNH endonuclease [Bacteroidia bacterium]